MHIHVTHMSHWEERRGEKRKKEKRKEEKGRGEKRKEEKRREETRREEKRRKEKRREEKRGGLAEENKVARLEGVGTGGSRGLGRYIARGNERG